VKSDHAQRLRILLGCRKLVVRKLVDTENEIRGTLRGFGLKPGHVSRTAFAGKVGELIAGKTKLLRRDTDCSSRTSSTACRLKGTMCDSRIFMRSAGMSWTARPVAMA
jgi:hypothetical protein